MFTGLIEDIGIVKKILKYKTSMNIQIRSSLLSNKLKTGDLISANGVCLTVKEKSNTDFIADVVIEKFKNSNLKYLTNGDIVNLESEFSKNDKFTGTVFQGHVDTTGQIVSILKRKTVYVFTVITDIDYSSYIIKNGSLTIDGANLKIIDSKYSLFSFSITPDTYQNTTLINKKIGSIVNIEFDIMGKYFKNLINTSNKKSTSKSKKYLKII